MKDRWCSWKEEVFFWNDQGYEDSRFEDRSGRIETIGPHDGKMVAVVEYDSKFVTVPLFQITLKVENGKS